MGSLGFGVFGVQEVRDDFKLGMYVATPEPERPAFFTQNASCQEPSEEVLEWPVPAAAPQEADESPKSTQAVWLSPLQWLAQGFREKGASGLRPLESESSVEETSPGSTLRCPSSPPLPRFKLNAGLEDTDATSREDGKRIYRKSFLSRREFDAQDSETSQSSQSVPQHWQQQVQQLMSFFVAD